MTHITNVATVLVPVSDQDAALAFFTDVLGLEQRADFAYAGGARWVEVAPPGAVTQLTLVVGATGIETGVILSTRDIGAAHAALRQAGVDVDERILREGDEPFTWAGAVQAGIPAMFRFRDPDGNSFLLVHNSGA